MIKIYPRFAQLNDNDLNDYSPLLVNYINYFPVSRNQCVNQQE